MKKNRAIVAALLAMVMLLLCACGGNQGAANNGTSNNAQTTNNTSGNDAAEPADNAGTEDTSSDNAAEPAEFDGKIHGPFIMTTCGQSTGSVMLHMVATQAGLTSTDDHSLTADTFEAGDAKTLVVTTGTSGKGMGAAGTDTAIETADVALMDDDLRKLPEFIKLSKKTFRLLVENIVIALSIKLIFFVLTLAGIGTMWMAVFADTGTCLIVVANGLRMLRWRG